MLNALMYKNSQVMEHFLEIQNAKTLTQAQHSFNRATIVLKSKAALLLFPLV